MERSFGETKVKIIKIEGSFVFSRFMDAMKLTIEIKENEGFSFLFKLENGKTLTLGRSHLACPY
jgi:hypothetical protein